MSQLKGSTEPVAISTLNSGAVLKHCETQLVRVVRSVRIFAQCPQGTVSCVEFVDGGFLPGQRVEAEYVRAEWGEA